LLRFIIGVFIILHGLVHLLYFGQSRRLFELQPGMVWPDGSLAFSERVGDKATRLLANISCVLAAVGFVVGGIGMVAGWTWWRSIVIGVVAFSTSFFVLFWDGKMRKLDDQGGIALIINIAILAAVLIW